MISVHHCVIDLDILVLTNLYSFIFINFFSMREGESRETEREIEERERERTRE